MEVYHPTNVTAISKDNYGGFEPVQHLAKQLFGLDNPTYIQIATLLDPRGYIDLYGEAPDKEYELQSDDGRGFKYHALACFFDHISIILENDVDCILTPGLDGIKLQIIDEESEKPLIENSVYSREDLVSAITGFLSISKNAEVDRK